MLRFFLPRKPTPGPTSTPIVHTPVANASHRALDRAQGAKGEVIFLDPRSHSEMGRMDVLVEAVEADRLQLGTQSAWPRDAAGMLTRAEILTDVGLVRFDVPDAVEFVAPCRYAMAMPAQVEREERRHFVRVRVIAKAKLEVPGEKPLEVDLGMVSAGGADFYGISPLSLGHTVKLSFSPEQGVAFTGLLGSVVRCRTLPNGRYLVALRFSDLTPVQENSLVQLVYKVQLRAGRSEK